MDNLKFKYESTKKSIQSLRQVITILDTKQQTMPLLMDAQTNRQILRDSLIQRFEYSVDTLWKYLKHYLVQTRGINQDSPKNIFRQCHASEIISPEETELLLGMVDDRNLTSHTYKEALAEKIASQIPAYCKIMEKLLIKTKI